MRRVAYQSFIQITLLTLLCYSTSLLVEVATGELLVPQRKILSDTYKANQAGIREAPALVPDAIDTDATPLHEASIGSLPLRDSRNELTRPDFEPPPHSYPGNFHNDVEIGMIKVVPMSMNDGLVNGYNIGGGQPPSPISRHWTNHDLQLRLRWLRNRGWTHFELAYDDIVMLPDLERETLKRRDQIMKAAARFGYEHLDNNGFTEFDTPLISRRRVSLAAENQPLRDVIINRDLQHLIRSQLLPPMDDNYKAARSLEKTVHRSHEAILARIHPSNPNLKWTDVGRTLFQPVWNPLVFEDAGFSPSAVRFYFVIHEMLQDFRLLLATERSASARSQGGFSAGLAWLKKTWKQGNINNFIIGERYQNHKKYKKLRNLKDYHTHGPEEIVKNPRPLDAAGPPASGSESPLAFDRLSKTDDKESPRKSLDESVTPTPLEDQLPRLRRRNVLDISEIGSSTTNSGKIMSKYYYQSAKQLHTSENFSSEETAKLLEEILRDYSEAFTRLYLTYSQLDSQFWPQFQRLVKISD